MKSDTSIKDSNRTGDDLLARIDELLDARTFLMEGGDGWIYLLRACSSEIRRLRDFQNEVSAEIASEGPHTLEHLMATAMLGKHTAVVGRTRLRQLNEARAAVEKVLDECEREISVPTTGSVDVFAQRIQQLLRGNG